jgi:hypothetical protein
MEHGEEGLRFRDGSGTSKRKIKSSRVRKTRIP